MKKLFFVSLLIAVLTAFCVTGVAIAGPDQYCGDTAIYGGSPTVVQPNVLVIVDDSGSMGDTVPGGAYVAGTPYPVVNRCTVSGVPNRPCVTDLVYTSSYDRFLDAGLTVANVTTSCAGANPQNLLQTNGQYNGRRLRTDGSCRTSGTGNYVTGNYINWRYGPGAPKQKVQIARDVVSSLINSTHNIKMGLMKYHYPSGNAQGAEFFSVSVSGTNYVTTIKDMDDIHTGVTTNRQALVASVNTLTDNGNTPLGESLVEAIRYFQGEHTAFGNTIGVDASGNYTSPIEYACQKNYIIFVTDGMSTADDSTQLDFINTTFGRYDGGGCTNPPYTTCANNRSHSLAGAAKYLYEQDLRPDASPGGLTGLQNVAVYTIGFGLSGADQEAIDLLALTADQNHGHGNYYLAGSETELSTAFTNIVSEIYQVNTSFVAPVVPVNPENRTYTGGRLYMGYFMPKASKFWSGNLKKFGLGCAPTSADPQCTKFGDLNILDAAGSLATYATLPSDIQHDFRDGTIVPMGSTNGSFRLTSRSYWSPLPDGGTVEDGGVGESLVNRATSRNIVTYLGSADTVLTSAANAFNAANLAPAALGLATTTERDNLINYLNGQDSYDEDLNGNTTEKRAWILGDILHSKPQIISYGSYTYSQETNCSINKTIIYVGGNDGMLHAFKDCDGSEAWAFIPPDVLPVLQYMQPTGNAHTYYVDFSPSAYVFNKSKTGVIDAATDKVVLVMGLRRGGGLDTSPTKGYYYALDVTDPAYPVFLWSISNDTKRVANALTSPTVEFSELAEAWSDISFGRIKLNTGVKIAAFIGAGYDNCNEDARYGPTQTFPGACVTIPTGDSGGTVSINGSAPLNPKGRGIYVIQIGEFDASGNFSLTSSGTKLWGYTNADNPGMAFSIPSKIKPLDTNFDGYIDRLYVGDTGGSMWTFDISSSTPGPAWVAGVRKVFRANAGADGSTGRKILYEPSAYVKMDGSIGLYFGTGDREHPLNTAVVDRMYYVVDKGQTQLNDISEARLVDVTNNSLQDPNATLAQVQTLMASLTSANNYGWYIKLESAGEKALAPSTLFNQVVVFTTYSPLTTPSSDPCVTGNLGTARSYLLDYLTGTAVVNFDTSNDSVSSSNSLVRKPGDINLMKSDRVITQGSGIPSGAVVVISKTGQATLMIGIGGSLLTLKTTGGGTSYPAYTRQKIEYQ